MIDKDLARSFLFMWDMMVKRYNDSPVLLSAYTSYRTAAEQIFFRLYNMDMALCSEVARGDDPGYYHV